MARPPGHAPQGPVTMLLIYKDPGAAREAHERFAERGTSYLVTCVAQDQPLYAQRYSRAKLRLEPEDWLPDFWDWFHQEVRPKLDE